MSGYRVAILRKEGYIHSRVFEEVANSIEQSLVELGLHDHLGRAIVFGANIISMFPDLAEDIPDDSILFNLEAASSPWMRNSAYLELLSTHLVLDYDASNVKWLQDNGVDVRHCPILYHPSMTRLTLRESEIDVLFYGSRTPRRTPILDAVEATGLRCMLLGHDDWDVRDYWIERAKVVLNIHAYDNAPLEMVRISFLLANRVCVVSEGPEVEQFKDMIWFSDAEHLADRCRAWCFSSNESRREVGERIYQEFSKMSQAKALKECLS